MLYECDLHVGDVCSGWSYAMAEGEREGFNYEGRGKVLKVT